MAKPRTAKVVIDAAIDDNLWWEYLCFTLIVVFVVTGITVVFLGYAVGNGMISLAGTGLAGLMWPAIRYVAKLRYDNMRIRLYEMALAEAKTTEEFATILREIFDRQPKRSERESP